MTKHFASLLEGYENQANNKVVKGVLYNLMKEYAYSYLPGYVCYDMDMYVALYKCANTSQERKIALERMLGIMGDDAFQTYKELLQDFKEFISLKKILKDEDKQDFDIICLEALEVFKKNLKWLQESAKCGHPDVSIDETKGELKEVAKIIISTGMSDLESYQEALEVLKEWFISREYVSRLFSNRKSP